VSVKLTGLGELLAKLKSFEKGFSDEVERALHEEAVVEQKESMRRTPVDLGPLRASHATRTEVTAKGIVAIIEVGGPAAPYAIYVHEDLEAHHPVGQAKFLESTINESKPHMAKRIAKRIDLNRSFK
jgi:hypothetical protein